VSDLTTLLDKQEITEICYRYAMSIDSRDWTGLSNCFALDAVAHYEGLPDCHDYQAIEDTCRGALTPLTASQHLIGNVVATVHGDTADCVCYFQAQHVKQGTEGGDNLIIAGRYRDEFVRTGSGWRIAVRNLDVMWVEGNPVVLHA
jgi:3-phenylpropionate/cinnamic acid dioxygenase small subunit